MFFQDKSSSAPKGNSGFPLRGMGKIIDGLSTGIDIRYGCNVARIEYMPGGQGVSVHTTDGRVHIAGVALLTLPLGCLQARAIDFSPPLPAWKSAAINRLGCGAVNKVWLQPQPQLISAALLLPSHSVAPIPPILPPPIDGASVPQGFLGRVS